MFDDHAGATGTEPNHTDVDGDGEVSGLVLLEQLRARLAAELEAEDRAALLAGPVAPFGLGAVHDTLAVAAVSDTAGVSDDDLLAMASTIEAARRRLDAVSLHALAELDVHGVTDTRHGLITGSWLAQDAQLPIGACKARVKLAQKLRKSLPEVDTALAEGRISFDHARVLADAANPRILDDFALVAGNLVDAAFRSAFDRWKREVAGLAELLDADGGHRPGDDPCDNRLRIRRGLDNTLHLDGQLCGEGALIAEHAMNAKADELFHRYRADQELSADLRMPPHTTLLAMAAVELFREALAENADTSTPARPEVALIVNASDPGVVTNSDGMRIGDTERTTVLCDPVFRAVVMAVHGVVTDTGHQQRLVNREQRRALTHRDGGCVFPACDRPANWTDAHHVWHWQHHGPTQVPLLASLCRYHHGVSHRDGWTMYVTAGQWFWWTTPSGDTFWSQRHGHQRDGPIPHEDTCTGPTGPGPARNSTRPNSTGPPDTS